MRRGVWILAGILFLGLSPAANAEEMMMKASPMPQKSGSMVVKPFLNRPNGVNGPVYTMLGLEMLNGGSCKAGWGMYAGLDLGVKNASNGFHYGGFLFRHENERESLLLNTGLLIGFGHTAWVNPNLTFNNFYLFGVFEPQLGVAWKISERASLGVDASYILTSNPAVAGGPTLSARLSVPFGRSGGMRCK